MMHYPFYEPAAGEIDVLLADMPAARLITAVDGEIAVGVFPFLADGEGGIELHMNKADPQLAMLRREPRCSLQVDDVLATIPSYWTEERAATTADLYYRSATLHAHAVLIDSAADIAAHLERLVRRYQGSDRHEPVSAHSDTYHRQIARLVMVRLQPLRWQAKFKLGQQESAEARARIHRNLVDAGRHAAAREAGKYL